jgi:hypothetical protein
VLVQCWCVDGVGAVLVCWWCVGVLLVCWRVDCAAGVVVCCWCVVGGGNIPFQKVGLSQTDPQRLKAISRDENLEKEGEVCTLCVHNHHHQHNHHYQPQSPTITQHTFKQIQKKAPIRAQVPFKTGRRPYYKVSTCTTPHTLHTQQRISRTHT